MSTLGPISCVTIATLDVQRMIDPKTPKPLEKFSSI